MPFKEIFQVPCSFYVLDFSHVNQTELGRDRKGGGGVNKPLFIAVEDFFKKKNPPIFST